MSLGTHLIQFLSIKFQFFSILITGSFSSFPHGTSSLLIIKEYLESEDGAPNINYYE